MRSLASSGASEGSDEDTEPEVEDESAGSDGDAMEAFWPEETAPPAPKQPKTSLFGDVDPLDRNTGARQWRQWGAESGREETRRRETDAGMVMARRHAVATLLGRSLGAGGHGP